MNTVPTPTDHHETGPSTWPALLACATFQRAANAEMDDSKDKGSRMHFALAAMNIQGAEASLPEEVELPEEEEDAVCWGHEQTWQILAEHCAPGTEVSVEERLDIYDPEENQWCFGTADLVAGPVIVDYKSSFNYRPGHYKPQFAGYALARMQQVNFRYKKILIVEVHLMPRKIRRYWITAEEAMEIAVKVLRRQPIPTGCEYCSLCEHAQNGSCPAVHHSVQVATSRIAPIEIDKSVQEMTPEKVGHALTIYKQHIESIGKALGSRAKELLESGVDVPGFKLQRQSGRRSVPDAALAHQLVTAALGLPANEFAAACSVSLSRLVDVYRRYAKCTKKDAEKIVAHNLAAAIEQGEPITKLVKK